MVGRWVRRIGMGSGLAVLAAVALLCLPEPVFAHHVRVGVYDVWSDRPIPRAIEGVLADATRRMARSELWSPDQRFRIFFCNDEWRLAVWSARGSGRMGGAADTYLTGNVYLRQADIASNRLIPHNGWNAALMADRPLSYYLAHEMTHVMEMRAFGRGLARFPSWLNEGYADVIGKGGQFDFAANRAAMLAGAREMNPKASGLYRRYHLEAAWLMERKGLTIRQLYAAPPDAAAVDREIAAAH